MIVVFEQIYPYLITYMYIYFEHVWTWLDINVFNPNICFVIFLWMKYMLHALVDILELSKIWNAQEPVMSVY